MYLGLRYLTGRIVETGTTSYERREIGTTRQTYGVNDVFFDTLASTVVGSFLRFTPLDTVIGIDGILRATSGGAALSIKQLEDLWLAEFLLLLKKARLRGLTFDWFFRTLVVKGWSDWSRQPPRR